MTENWNSSAPKGGPMVDVPCVIGRGWLREDGYREVARHLLAHRSAWEDAHGPIPNGMQLHHLCKNKECVSVEHLVLVTHREHKALHRGCDHDDRYTTKDGRHSRCRICTAERQRERRADPESRERLAEQRRVWRRGKYRDDPEYRERVSAQNRASRQKKSGASLD